MILALASLPLRAGNANPCGMTHFHADDAPVIPNAESRRSCLNPTPDTRVCLENGDNERIIIERGGQHIGEWPTSTVLGDTRFDIFIKSSPGQGVDQWLIAVRQGVTNGIAIEFWNLYLFPEPQSGVEIKPAVLNVEDFGVDGSFKRIPKGRCAVLESHWVNNAVNEGHLYFVGRWMDLSANRFVKINTQPILARQYLQSFERERLKAIDEDDPRRPAIWLQHGRLTKLPKNWKPPKIEPSGTD